MCSCTSCGGRAPSPGSSTRRVWAGRGAGLQLLRRQPREIKRLRDDTAGAALDVGDHDFVPMVQPHFRKWIPVHGRTFLYWFGARPIVCVGDVNVVKQVLPNYSGMYPKNIRNPHIARLLSKGMVLADWKRHRKVVHPAFNKRSRRSTSSVFMVAVMANSAEKIRLVGNQNVMVSTRAAQFRPVSSPSHPRTPSETPPATPPPPPAMANFELDPEFFLPPGHNIIDGGPDRLPRTYTTHVFPITRRHERFVITDVHPAPPADNVIQWFLLLMLLMPEVGDSRLLPLMEEDGNLKRPRKHLLPILFRIKNLW
ncbi:Secologanin synthase [Hordeum vulgare]|nr:Secologanin synthase [Hordeum vulgare]